MRRPSSLDDPGTEAPNVEPSVLLFLCQAGFPPQLQRTFSQRQVRDILCLCESVCSVVIFSDLALYVILLLHRSVLHSKDCFLGTSGS